jgi:hypothetical protein
MPRSYPSQAELASRSLQELSREVGNEVTINVP